MMMTSSTHEDSAMCSWKDLVKVNGSFYCNLSLKGVDSDLGPSPPPSPPPPPPQMKSLNSAEQRHHASVFRQWAAAQHEPIYVNSCDADASVNAANVNFFAVANNRTILRIGEDSDEVRQTQSPSVDNSIDAAELSGDNNSLSSTTTTTSTSCHTIKLVIGEPLSLDTSEYVSWDGSQTEARSAASADDDDDDEIPDEDDDDEDDDDEEDDSDGEDSGSEEAHLQPDSLASVSSPTSSHRPSLTVDDELTHSCCRFFDQRQQKLSSIVSATWNRTSSSTLEAADSISSDASQQQQQQQQQPAKSPIPGLQDKMEHLRREIVSLVNQDDALFRQLLALNTSIHQLRSQSLQRRVRTLSSSRSRGQLSPALSAASLTSLTSLSDGEDDVEVEGDDSDPDPSKTAKSALSAVTERPNSIMAQLPKPVAPPQMLTRKRVSYPPKSRNRSNSQLSRCSFNSSSSSSSSSSTSSGSPTWSLSSADAKAIVKGVKTPRSPHSSFYSRSPAKNPQLTARQRSASEHADLLMVFHKRQGSYDSGCQGSEPSDAEVFV